MATKWEINRAVRASNLPAPSRLIMLTLSDMAEAATAEIPERHTPSLTELARQTGLGRSTVAQHLLSLEETKWVVRDRPEVAAARANGERTCYRLTVPAGAPVVQELDGLVQERDHSEAEVVQELDHPSPAPGLPLVQELDGGSPGAGPNRTISTTSTTNTIVAAAAAAAAAKAAPSAKPAPTAQPRTVAPSTGSTRPPIVRFDEFWAVYPLSDGEAKARQAWAKAIKRAEPDAIIAGAARYRDWPRRNPDYTKLAANWLADNGWQDAYVAAVAPRQQSTQPEPAYYRPLKPTRATA
ncbi:hypothetical protein Cme02nite_38470 [Catellatospora methionotrophica]|uniref:HTH iclR-type domain-containing protein n=1 Tax=Catellatospora methionotrophica TaxID=121620 RepID=A0A8J3LB52_9ACTN|nr:ArsR family transcriptional regulator [Catellatospora methionotrophica]GIG15515.1 hypothetical protein Cme02nite_38470 [Catellatospora methionotrophica]